MNTLRWLECKWAQLKWYVIPFVVVILVDAFIIHSYAQGIKTIEVVIASLSLYVAICSILFSSKTQNSLAFNHLFNTQISLLRNYFNAECLQRTVFMGCCEQTPSLLLTTPQNDIEAKTIRQDIPVYKNFCRYFRENVQYIGDSELDSRQICSIWDSFCNKLEYRSEFEYSFKYIYLCLRTITDEDLSTDEKKKYIGIVTDLINSEQLFCYYINQIANCRGNCEGDETVKVLRETNFFRDLFYSVIYKQVEDAIPQHVKKWFIKNN